MDKKVLIVIVLVVALTSCLIAVFAMGGFVQESANDNSNSAIIPSDDNSDVNNVVEEKTEPQKSWKLIDSYEGKDNGRVSIRSDGNPLKVVLTGEPMVMGSPSRAYERFAMLTAVQNKVNVLDNDIVRWESRNPKFVSKTVKLEFTLNGEANINVNVKGVSWTMNIYSYS